MFPSRGVILKLPIIWYKVSTKPLWHFRLQRYGATDDGKDSIKRRLIGDTLWWLKVVDRQEQSIEERLAFDSVVTSPLFLTGQNRGRGRDKHREQGERNSQPQVLAHQNGETDYVSRVGQGRLSKTPASHSLSLSLSLCLSLSLRLQLHVPFCGSLGPVIRNKEEGWQEAKRK